MFYFFVKFSPPRKADLPLIPLHASQEEIQRGQMIFQNNKSFSGPFPWDALSASGVGDFFSCSPRYIQVRKINRKMGD